MRHPRGALCLLFILGACAPAAEGPPRVQTENELAARTLMGLWGAATPADVAGLFHPDAVYDDFANQHQHQGLQEIGVYIARGLEWATAVDLSVTSIHASETGATVEWVLSAIQDRPAETLVPGVTGREVVVNGVTILEIDGGRIRRAADYMDVLTLLLQLGAEVRLPGGGTLQLDLPPAEEIP